MKCRAKHWSSVVFRSPTPLIILMLAIGWMASRPVLGDGCFVMPPFVWDKHRDINEPAQKAIILYDAGREDLILQVKYEGPVEQFGWLIPVPGLPTVQQASMKCFYELSRYMQEHLEPRFVYGMASLDGHDTKEPSVKVIEVKTVGAYDIAVLSTKDAKSLQEWLDANQFSYPKDKTDVITSYVKQQWFFVAVKIHLNKKASFRVGSTKAGSGFPVSTATKAKLANGELQPLQISFDTDKCIFPLKISSVNGLPSEVQIYLLSAKPLIEKSMYEKGIAAAMAIRAEATAKRAEAVAEEAKQKPLQTEGGVRMGLMRRIQGEFDPPPKVPARKRTLNEWFVADEILHYGQVTVKDIPRCRKQLSRLNGQSWWLTKKTWKFKPDDMHDLEFQPAVTLFAEKLRGQHDFTAAVNLRGLGPDGIAELAVALRSADAEVRITAAAATLRWPRADRMLREILATRLNDSEPEMRCFAVSAIRPIWDAKYIEPLVGLLSDADSEVNNAAVAILKDHRNDLFPHVPLFQKMLRDQKPELQAAGFKLLSVVQTNIAREDLLRLFKHPDKEVLVMAYARLRAEKLSCEEAAPLLRNSMMLVRIIGLNILFQNNNSRAVEMAIPLLRDREKEIQDRAWKGLRTLTGEDIPKEEPEKWEQWWVANKATFVPKAKPSLNKR